LFYASVLNRIRFLGVSAGSIDPLGSFQTYGSLVGLLLPGLTTSPSVIDPIAVKELLRQGW
jgi:hypothetical protein